MTPEEQAAHTPFTVLRAARALGKIPAPRMLELDPSGQKYYFQNDKGKLCLTRYNSGPQTQTPELLAVWQTFRDAVAAWQALTPQEKEAWNRDPEAGRRAITGYTLFLSKYLKGLL